MAHTRQWRLKKHFIKTTRASVNNGIGEMISVICQFDKNESRDDL